MTLCQGEAELIARFGQNQVGTDGILSLGKTHLRCIPIPRVKNRTSLSCQTGSRSGKVLVQIICVMSRIFLSWTARALCQAASVSYGYSQGCPL